MFYWQQDEALQKRLIVADHVDDAADNIIDDEPTFDYNSSDEDIFSATPQREATMFKSKLMPTEKIVTPTTKHIPPATTKTATPATKNVLTPTSKMNISPAVKNVTPKSKLGTTAMTSPSIQARFVASQNSEHQPDDDVDVSSFCVVSTGLNRQKRETFSRFLSTFKIATSNVLDDNVTHVVVDVTPDDRAVRTLKYIQVIFTII